MGKKRNHRPLSELKKELIKRAKSKEFNIKQCIETILHCPNFCGLCFGSFDDLIPINNVCNNTGLPIITLLTVLFGNAIQKEIISEHICAKCKKEVEGTYKFITKIHKSIQTINNYLTNLDQKVQKIDKGKQENITIYLTSNTDVLKSENIEKCSKKLITDCQCNSIFSKNSPAENTKLNSKDKCSECTSGCRYEKYLIYAKKESDRTQKCKDCYKEFTNISSLVSHINTYHLDVPLLCEKCGVSFDSHRNKINHTCSCKSELNGKNCGFDIKNEFKQHKIDCVIDRPYKCEACGLTFKDDFGLKKHAQNNCGSIKILKTDGNLQLNSANTKKSQTKKELVRECHLCPNRFKTLKELLSHLKDHGPNELYNCDTCKKHFLNRTALLTHLNSYLHKRRVDPNFVPKYKCDVCSLTFTLRFQLERHKNVKHFKVLPYSCDKCGKRFAATINLKAHILRHGGTKNFQCNYCSALFTEQNGLKSHILRQHKPEKKPCACEMCGKTFVCMSEIKIHQQRQHSEKKFSCPLCSGMFYTNTNRRAHIRKVHFKGRSLEEFVKENCAVKYELDEVFRDRRLPHIAE